MIDLYTAATPNGKKVVLMLEELGVAYQAHSVNLKEQEQKKPEFLAMNPNGRIPVIVDSEAAGGKLPVFESGAILFYLAEKYGKFFGKGLEDKAKVMEWVMFQMSGIGPMFGNHYYGKNYLQPANPAYIERFELEAKRLITVLEKQLSKNTYLAGEEYSIADICSYHWIASYQKSYPEWFSSAPSVLRWLATVAERPAVKKVPV